MKIFWKNSDLVALLRDCVSSTWGDPSIDKTQANLDKFLQDRKILPEKKKLLNLSLSSLFQLLDKHRTQSEFEWLNKRFDKYFDKIIRKLTLPMAALLIWHATENKIAGIQAMMKDNAYTLSQAYRCWNIYEKTTQTD